MYRPQQWMFIVWRDFVLLMRRAKDDLPTWHNPPRATWQARSVVRYGAPHALDHVASLAPARTVVAVVLWTTVAICAVAFLGVGVGV